MALAIGFRCGLVAFVTVLVSQSLFPDRRNGLPRPDAAASRAAGGVRSQARGARALRRPCSPSRLTRNDAARRADLSAGEGRSVVAPHVVRCGVLGGGPRRGRYFSLLAVSSPSKACSSSALPRGLRPRANAVTRRRQGRRVDAGVAGRDGRCRRRTRGLTDHSHADAARARPAWFLGRRARDGSEARKRTSPGWRKSRPSHSDRRDVAAPARTRFSTGDSMLASC